MASLDIVRAYARHPPGFVSVQVQELQDGRIYFSLTNRHTYARKTQSGAGGDRGDVETARNSIPSAGGCVRCHAP